MRKMGIPKNLVNMRISSEEEGALTWCTVSAENAIYEGEGSYEGDVELQPFNITTRWC